MMIKELSRKQNGLGGEAAETANAEVTVRNRIMVRNVV